MPEKTNNTAQTQSKSVQNKLVKNAWTQTITTNKTKVETFFVIMAALLIVVISAIIIQLNQVSHKNSQELKDHEISLRYDLKPNEQGIFSDLLLVYQDWKNMSDVEQAPEITTLIEDDWPPFTDVLMRKNRGSHKWKKQDADDSIHYVGVSQNTQLSGHFLWIMPKVRNKSTEEKINVWLYQEQTSPPKLGHVHARDLSSMGWKKINAVTEVHRP